MGNDRYEDLYVVGQPERQILRSCDCYPAGSLARAHLVGCRYYTVEQDPFIRPRWFIHRLDKLWCVCQARVRTGYHDTEYRGATWEDAVVWLAVEYGRRRTERRVLETIIKRREATA